VDNVKRLGDGKPVYSAKMIWMLECAYVTRSERLSRKNDINKLRKNVVRNMLVRGYVTIVVNALRQRDASGA
jgi:hypothetical protein